METPQKRHKSWFSSLTGLVSGGRPSAQDDSPSSFSSYTTKTGASTAYGDRVSSRPRPGRQDDEIPARHTGTFSAPPVDSPESPAKRASPTLLAQRKMHDRVLGPSGRLNSTSGNSGLATSNTVSSLRPYNKSTSSNHSVAVSSSRFTSTPRRTNFSSATTPRNMFRDSISHGAPAFTFTPRVPPNTIRGNFPATTPGRSYRASGIEMSAREMAKISSSDLFPMKIPDPDAALSGEAIAGMVPKDLKTGNRSIYASEYMAHLCPPDFNEEQRNQFFCILDLRRLKYAADEVFLKKDWRLNILNFAKEYEKNRSLIMLRYGLYEFKTVKVSKDVFQKWKTANNVPDLDDEYAQDDAPANSHSSELPASAKTGTALSKPNGTEGILRAGKRKAQDNIEPPAAAGTTSALATSNKRSRPMVGRASEREPLSETSTPTLNKAKRKATVAAGLDSWQGEKILKPTQVAAPSSAPSATKSFFEKVANSSTKDDPTPTSASTTSIFAANLPVDTGPIAKSSSLFKSSTMSQLPTTSSSSKLARSVLENGLKNSATTNNIFGHLADASSTNNGNMEEDSDESDREDDEEVATERKGVDATSEASSLPSSTLFFPAKPAVPPANSDQAPGSSASSQTSEAPSGRSLFERVNKDSDGQPIRVFGSKSTPERATPEKESAIPLFTANKTWTTSTPIKFASASITAPSPPNDFAGAASTSDVSKQTGTESATAAPATFELTAASSGPTVPTPDVTSPSTQANSQTSTPPLFSFLNKPAESTVSASAGGKTVTLFGNASGAPTPASSIFSKGLVSKEQTSTSLSTTTPTALSAPLSAPAMPAAPVPSFQSGILFGASSKPATLTKSLKRSVDDDIATSAKSTTGSDSAFTPFRNSGKGFAFGGDEPNTKRPLFGNGFSNGPATESAPASSAPLFSFSAPKANGETEKEKPAEAPVFPKAPEAKPLFSTNVTGASAGPPKVSALFGGTTPVATTSSASGLFSLGGESSINGSAPTVQPSTNAPLFSFGSSSKPLQETNAAPAQSSFAGTLSFDSGNGTSSAGSSFTFNVGGVGGTKPFNNPFASAGGDSSVPSFGAGAPNGSQPSAASNSTPFQFGAGGSSTAPAPNSVFSFGGGPSQPTPASTQNSSLFGNNNELGNSAVFSFGAGAPAQTNSMPLFGQHNSASGTPLFNLTPPVGGTSTGTNTPFTNLGGASSLATTPATGTPEPGATQDNADNSGHQADGDEAPQVQLSLTEGGLGEEDEAVVHEVRTKVLRLVPPKEGTDGDDSPTTAAAPKKSPWKTEGVGPLRVLKHKTTGAIRLLLRGEPRGHVVLNRALLPNFTYKPDPNSKYVKLTTGDESGNGLETWMVQVKTKEAAQTLANVLEEQKLANKK